MKRFALLAVAVFTITIDSTTIIDLPSGAWMAVIRGEEPEGTSVDCGTPTVKLPKVSTGPYVLKATTGDCYRLEFINPNGTIPKSPLDWVPCPL